MTYTPEVWANIIAEGTGGGGGTGGGYDAIFKTNGIDLVGANAVELVSGDFETVKAKAAAGEYINIAAFNYDVIDENVYYMNNVIDSVIYNAYDDPDSIEVYISEQGGGNTAYASSTSGGSTTKVIDVPIKVRKIIWKADGCTLV